MGFVQSLDINKSDLYEMLNSNICVVDFDKLTGEKRKMRCTLDERYTPEVSQSRSKPDNLMIVYDIEKEGWRSFYIDRVNSVEVVKE